MNIIIKKDNNLYRFQKDFDCWKPLSKKITLSKKIITVIKKDNLPLSKKIMPLPIIKDIDIKTLIKDKYGDFVYLTKDEYKKLQDQFGETGTQDRIKTMNDYAHQIGQAKFIAKYKSHYHTLLNWARREIKKPISNQPAVDPDKYAKYGGSSEQSK
jgi:hypothetical protein